MEMKADRRGTVKKFYKSPKLEIQNLTVADIIAGSETIDSNEDWTPWK